MPILLLIAVITIIFFVIALAIKKRTKFYYVCIVSLSVAISCLYLMFAFDSVGIWNAKGGGLYIASKNGKWGAFNQFGTELYPFTYDKYLIFHRSNEHGTGVLVKNEMYFVINKKGDRFVAERLVSPNFNLKLDNGRYASQMYTAETYGFVALVNEKFYLVNDCGELIIPMGFDSYIKDHGSTLWIKNDEKWGAFDIASKGNRIVESKYDDCQLAENGMLLREEHDVYFAQWDEGNLLFYNLSEQQREYEQNQRNALLLLMLFNQTNNGNNYQMSQMNDIYQSCGVSGRSREQIQDDINHLKQLQSEANGSGGIAESIGYGQIQTKYDAIIAERERELMMADH